MCDFVRTILAFAVLLAATNSYATTIVAVKTPKEIYLGADSKFTDTFGNAVENQACKIFQSGSLFFASAGLARDTKSAFSVPEIAGRALASDEQATVFERTEKMTKAVATALTEYLPNLKKRSFVTFREKIEGRTFLRIVVAGFEKGKPAIFVRLFRFGRTESGENGVIVSNDDCDENCKGKVVTRFLGEIDAIDGLPEETKGFWKSGFAAGVRKLIETQIAAREEYVGPPIDILQITAKRAVWIQKKPSCAEVSPIKK